MLVEDAISGLYDRGKDEITGIGVRLMRTREVIDRIGGVVPRVRNAARVA